MTTVYSCNGCITKKATQERDGHMLCNQCCAAYDQGTLKKQVLHNVRERPGILSSILINAESSA